MPLPRSYSAVVDGTDGIGFSNVSGQATYGAVQIISARQILCPGCQARPGEACTTGRMSDGKHPAPLLCPERIALTRSLRDQGQLQMTEVAPQVSCRKCSTYGGHVNACPEHRCQNGHCVNAALPGSRWCDSHGKSRLKMTPERISEMTRLRAEGLSKSEIARGLGVSYQTIYNHLR